MALLIFSHSEARLVTSMPSSSRVEFTPAYFALKKFIKDSDKNSVTAGFLGNQTYENGEQVGDVAKKNEFGVVAQNQPPRPFMRPAIDIIKENAQGIMSQGITQGISGGSSIEDSLAELGQYSASEIMAAIRNVTTPQLSPRTIAARRERGNTSVKPLEDTETMINSVDYEVSS